MDRLHKPQVARWNKWSDEEKATQLAMSFCGSAQRVLSDLSNVQLSDYTILRSAFTQIFCPTEQHIVVSSVADADNGENPSLTMDTL